MHTADAVERRLSTRHKTQGFPKNVVRLLQFTDLAGQTHDRLLWCFARLYAADFSFCNPFRSPPVVYCLALDTQLSARRAYPDFFRHFQNVCLVFCIVFLSHLQHPFSYYYSTLGVRFYCITPETPSQEEKTDSETEQADTIVVYFSATGHTEPLAGYAAEYLNADIYEIIPETPYTDADLNYNDSSSRSSKEQNDDSARPAISGELPELSGYDTIIIGHPIWWGQAPKIIYTFLESYDLSGKTLTTFCTSASSGLGSSAENLKKAVQGTDNVWHESRRFSIGADRDEVTSWLQQIGLTGTQKEMTAMTMYINDMPVDVDWDENVTVEELRNEAAAGDISIDMSMYGGWEQVGSLGKSYTRNDTHFTAECGDIVLYSGNQIVVFYGSNSWDYTHLGKIKLSEDEVQKLFGNEDVTLKLTAE